MAFLDLFAGAGVYEDGSPGSPHLALKTAEALATFRELRCYFVESNRKNFERLSELIATSPAVNRSRAMRGDATHYLQGVLHEVGDLPLFVFVDPFGLGLPFDDLIGKLLARTSWVNGRRIGPATEVLVNFVHAGVYRNASKIAIRTDDPVQQANAVGVVRRVNATLGGDWWQSEWGKGGTTARRVADIRNGYSERVVAGAGAGWRSYTVQVQDSWQGQPVYDLILFTQSEHGMWVFNEATSLARKEFRHFCNVDAQPTLWDPEEQWVETVARNVHELLRAGRPVRVFDHIEAIFGSTLGFARGTHLRKALRQLNAAAAFAAPPKGEFEKMGLLPNPRGLPDLPQTGSLL